MENNILRNFSYLKVLEKKLLSCIENKNKMSIVTTNFGIICSLHLLYFC